MGSQRHLLLLVGLCSLAAGPIGCSGESNNEVKRLGIEDFFCHGQPDRVPCDDFNPCTDGDICGLGVCKGRPLEDGTVCGDGSMFSVSSACIDGQCVDPQANSLGDVHVSQPDACTDCDAGQDEGSGGTDPGAVEPDPGVVSPNDEGADIPSTPDIPPSCGHLHDECGVGRYDDQAGDCVRDPIEAGCDDGDPCTTADSCRAGTCDGDVLDLGSACDDGDLCTVGDACFEEGCRGRPVECFDDTRECFGICDPATGECAPDAPAPDGTECDDRNPCTVATVCTAGTCSGGVDECFCTGKDDGTSCDDGQACTVSDECREGHCEGRWMNCSNLDDTCNEGTCQRDTGACVKVPRAAGTPCEDGSLCTVSDSCSDGVCEGEPRDCSDGGGPCSRGECDAGSGECVFLHHPNGTPCDDGNPCSGHDQCSGGGCRGPFDVCTPCEGVDEGGACDDGDACTSNTTCTSVGLLRICAGEATSCTEMDDACRLGVCESAVGSCLAIDRVDGTSCDDEAPCTIDEACAAGVCEAEPVDLCGDDVETCALRPFVGDVGLGLPLDAAEESRSLLAAIDPPGQTDWYSVELLAGQHLHIRTRPHCGSELDTIAAIYRAGVETPLEVNDDAGDGRWSEIEGFAAAESGLYLIAITAYASSGAGTYLLDYAAPLAGECEADIDCGCGLLECRAEEGTPTLCLPSIATEQEPNDDPDDAMAITLDDPFAADIQTPGDVDYFAIELTEGEPVGVETRDFCDTSIDTEIRVLEPGTLRVLAADGESGTDAHGHVHELMPERTGLHLIEIREAQHRSGPYVLFVHDQRCTTSAECGGCSDAMCRVGDQPPGVCVPRIDAPEPADPAAPPTALVLGDRVHGRIDAPFDVDLYGVALTAGSFDVSLGPYCGPPFDGILELLDPTGMEVRASAELGADGHSRVTGHEIEHDGTYVIRVSTHGPATGRYIVQVRPSSN